MNSTHAEELTRGDRFAFGENWRRFLSTLDESRIAEAEQSLKSMLEAETLEGQTFLDIGSGSGLFSLAARRLGARVTSFDFDPQSVACTTELRRRYFEHDPAWRIDTGSALDADYVRGLGTFDIVYSWGVLHHTGHMWKGLEHAAACVAGGGRLFVALYNYQPFASRYWTFVKRSYNKLPLTRPFWIGLHLVYPTLPSLLLRLWQGRHSPRGMSVWHDLLDWLGGFPFEVARPEEVFEFYRRRDFELSALKTVGGRMGCNEFVFRRRT